MLNFTKISASTSYGAQRRRHLNPTLSAIPQSADVVAELWGTTREARVRTTTSGVAPSSSLNLTGIPAGSRSRIATISAPVGFVGRTTCPVRGRSSAQQ